MRQPSGPDAYAFLDHDGPIAFAHRGGAAGGVENSLRAFQHAVDLGYRYVETDVYETSDGVLLAFHDRTLDRVTDLTGRIAALPHSHVLRARIGGSEPIPTLEDVLGSWPELRVNIDVKAFSATSALVEVIRRTALGPSRVALLRVASMSRLAGLLVPRAVPCARVPDRLGPLRLVTHKLVELAHRHGVRVHVWTIDDAAEMRRLLDLGVDGIMTDRIDTLRDVMVERGSWPT